MANIPELRVSENTIPKVQYAATREADWDMNWVVRRNGWYVDHGSVRGDLREKYPGLEFQS